MTDKYEHLPPLPHFLKCTPMYMGATQAQPAEHWVLEDGRAALVEAPFCFAAMKMMDEVVQNACDNIPRGTRAILVAIDAEHVRVDNDGPTILIARKPEWGDQWVPEGVMTRFGSGENFGSDATQVAGTNGIGVKGVVALSRKFALTCRDGERVYAQTFENNMSVVGAADVKNKKTRAGTTVEFWPDFSRFADLPSYEPMLGAMAFSVHRAAAFFSETKFSLNSVALPMDLARYAALFAPTKVVCRKAVAAAEELRYAFALSPREGLVVDACVNGIYTPHGGTHVNKLLELLVDGFRKQTGDAPPALIKSRLCLIVFLKTTRPKFNGQTKTEFTSRLDEALLLALKQDVATYFARKDVTGVAADVIARKTAQTNAQLSKSLSKKTGEVAG